MAFHMRTTILILGVIVLMVPACGIVVDLVPENVPSLQTIDEGDSFSIWCNFSMSFPAGFNVTWEKVNTLNGTGIRPIYTFKKALKNNTKRLNDFSKRDISATCTSNKSDLLTTNCLIRISNASYCDGGNYTCSFNSIGKGSFTTSEEYQTVRVIVPPTLVNISQQAVTSTNITLECVTSYLYPGEHPADDILWYRNGKQFHVTLAKDLKCNSLNSSLCQSFSAQINVSMFPNKSYQCGSSDIRSEVFLFSQSDDSIYSTDIPEPTNSWLSREPIVPKSQENFAYISFWSILLCVVALFLGLLIIVMIVYNRRKKCSRAVHTSRQNTRTNRRRRRDALRLNVEGLIYADLDIIGRPPKRTTFIEREKTEYVQIRRV